MKALSAALMLGLAVASLSFADEEPWWLLYETGRQEMDRGEYGRALHLFAKVLDLKQQRPAFPEVQMALGDIYRIEGEKELAARQYAKAYNQKLHFLSPLDAYTVLYRQASLYKNDDKFDSWLTVLQTLLKEDREYYSDVFSRLREALLNIYRDKGLDRLLQLYRLDYRPVGPAHAQMGEYHNRFGSSKQEAVVHYLFAVVILLTDAIEEVRRTEPAYSFRDVRSFFEHAARRRNVMEYLYRVDIFKQLYYLGVASHALGAATGEGVFRRRARDIWFVLRQVDGAERYGELASSQLLSPWEKPFLYPD